MFEKIRAKIAEQLSIDENDITMDSGFVDDLGADSLDLVELIMALEEEFDMEIPDEDAEKITSVGLHKSTSRRIISAGSVEMRNLIFRFILEFIHLSLFT